MGDAVVKAQCKGSEERFPGAQSRSGQERFHKEVTFELDMEWQVDYHRVNREENGQAQD